MLDNHVLSNGVSKIVLIPTNPEYAYLLKLPFIKQQVLKFHLLTLHLLHNFTYAIILLKKLQVNNSLCPREEKKRQTDTCHTSS